MTLIFDNDKFILLLATIANLNVLKLKINHGKKKKNQIYCVCSTKKSTATIMLRIKYV